MHMKEHVLSVLLPGKFASYRTFLLTGRLFLARLHAEGCVLVWGGQRGDCIPEQFMEKIASTTQTGGTGGV